MNEALYRATFERNPNSAKKMTLVPSECLLNANAIIEVRTSTNRQSQILPGLKQFAQEK